MSHRQHTHLTPVPLPHDREKRRNASVKRTSERKVRPGERVRQQNCMIIYNTQLVRLITFGFAAGICIFPFILVRDDARDDAVVINHERIHYRQQAELLVLGFHLLYLVMLLANLVRHRRLLPAYRALCFEREAYAHDRDADYLRTRKPYACFRTI